MPARTIPLITDQIYHIFNKIQNDEPILTLRSVYQSMIDALWYYQYGTTPMKLSYFRHQPVHERNFLVISLEKKSRLVDILAYCLMPNHYHLLLRQREDAGISLYMSKVQNSITRFTNIKRKKKGHVFIGQFRTVRMESEEQLLHVSRYIHLNPYTGYVVKTIEETKKYLWSSYGEYISKTKGVCDQSSILAHFTSKRDYDTFIEDQKDYQRTLADIKYSVFE